MSISKPNLCLLMLVSALMLSGCTEESPQSAAEHSANAQQFLAEGDVASATIEVKNALRSEPKNPDIRWLAGQIYLAAGKSRAAEQEFTKALELGISVADADLPLVRSWIAQGEIQKGLDHFENKTPDSLSEEAKTLFAELLLQSGEISRAEEIFADLVNTSADIATAQLGLARISLSRGNTTAAKDYVQSALKSEPDNPFANLIAGELAIADEHLDQAETHFAAATADPRTQLLGSLGAVRVQLARKDFHSAETALAGIAAEHPNVPLASYLQGLTYYQLGEFSAATDALEKTQTLAPRHNPTLLLLGKLYLSDNQLELANETLATLFASDPANVPGRTLFAATKLRMGLPSEALVVLGDTVTPQSDNLLALITAGSALLESGDYTRGAELLEKAATLAEDPRPIQSQLARMHLQAGDVDTAIEEYRTLIKSDTSNPQHYLLLAYSLVRQGKLDQAMDAADQLSAQGLTAVAANLKGAIELARKQPDAARKLFKISMENAPDFVPPRLNLARLVLSEKHPDEAREIFAKVLEIDPVNVSAILGIASIDIKNDAQASAVRRLKEAAKSVKDSRILLALANLMMEQRNPAMALDYASQAVRLAPTDPNSARTVAEIQSRQGLGREAMEALESIPDSRRNDAFNLHLAKLYARNGHGDRAREMLSDLLGSAPGNPGVLITAIAVELAAKQIEPAQSLLDNFSGNSDQTKPLLTTLQGDIHRSAGRHQQALDSYEKAFAAQPNSNLVGSLVGELVVLDRRPEAIAKLTAWTGEHSEDVAQKLRLAGLQMANGEKTTAVALYREVLDRQPDHLLALNNLAWLYFEQGDPQALKLAMQIADSNPDNAAVLDTAGWILLKQGDKARGLDLLLRAHDQAEKTADILFHLAVAQQVNGDLEETNRLLAKLLDAHAEYAKGDDVQRFIADMAVEQNTTE